MKAKPKTIRCSTCTKHLSALVDGEISGQLAEAVQAHVASCTRCADQLARLRALHGALEELPKPQLADGFDDAFARKLQQAKRAQKRTTTRRGWGRLRQPAFALAAAALCAAVVLSLLVLRQPPADRPSPENELELAMNLDLLRDYDVINNLEALEDFEVVDRLGSLQVEEGIR